MNLLLETGNVQLKLLGNENKARTAQSDAIPSNMQICFLLTYLQTYLGIAKR